MAAPVRDWFLADWALMLGKRQADFVRDLGWNKSKASLVWRGDQPYTRDMVNEVADYLNLEPFELLMHPADASAIKRFRESAFSVASLRMVADAERNWAPEQEVPPAFRKIR